MELEPEPELEPEQEPEPEARARNRSQNTKKTHKKKDPDRGEQRCGLSLCPMGWGGPNPESRAPGLGCVLSRVPILLLVPRAQGLQGGARQGVAALEQV